MLPRLAVALIGVVIAVPVSLAAVMRGGGAFAALSCPPGWQSAFADGQPQNRLILSCSAAEAKLTVEYNFRGSVQLPPAVAADGSHETVGSVERWLHTRDSEGPKLLADVYFLSAGRRYGMLSIVHGPEARFTNDEQIAPWLETIQGTAPWGSPQELDMHAVCPAGFQTMPATGARMVVRCMSAPGTKQFVVLQLLWSEGGFGNEQDRARLAGDIAQRVASSGGGTARVIEQPTPYTRARNVDAMRGRFETDEKVTLTDASQWSRTSTSGNLGVWYRGPFDAARIEQAEGVLAGAKYRRLSPTSSGLIVGLASLVGAMIALVSSKMLEPKKPARV